MRSIVLMMVLAAVVGAAQRRPSPRGLNLFSLPQEIELGQKAAEQLEQTLGVVHQPEVDAYLNALGHALAAQTQDPRSMPYTFAVYKGDTDVPPNVLAFPYGLVRKQGSEPLALAGGPVFVPLSLLKSMGTEPELAAALAHAIAHIELRHPTRQETRGRTVNQPTLQNPAAAPSQAPVGFYKYARDFEYEADLEALYLLAFAGYDPQGLALYLQSLPKHVWIKQMFATLPSPKERLKAIEAAAKQFPVRNQSPTAGQFAAFRAAVMGL